MPTNSSSAVDDTDTAEKYVYDFAEGSREMREMLGGKGANICEMTRLLGADLVPAGFVITTDACVIHMSTGEEPPELAPQVDAALERLQAYVGRRFGDADYAFEELIAELGAAFLCSAFGIVNTPRPDHAAYIANWLDILGRDRRAIFTAASAAQEAVEYLRTIAGEQL